MKCLSCGKSRAQLKQPWGYLPCKKCQIKQKAFGIKGTIEITTDFIREERKEYAKDIEQRYEGNIPNLNYINAYGTDGFSREELKAAQAAHTTYYRDSWEKYNPKSK